MSPDLIRVKKGDKNNITPAKTVIRQSHTPNQCNLYQQLLDNLALFMRSAKIFVQFMKKVA